jgi:DNA-binding SARP family transcriptional activator
VRVGLLGPLWVVGDDGAELVVTAFKERAVLSWLALRAGAPVRSAELIAVLWGDVSPVSAVKTLQNYVAALRRVLPAGVIETVPGGYRLAVGSDDVDVGRFERLARDGQQALKSGDSLTAADRLGAAVALWRGDPLVELADVPSGMGESARLARPSFNAATLPQAVTTPSEEWPC